MNCLSKRGLQTCGLVVLYLHSALLSLNDVGCKSDLDWEFVNLSSADVLWTSSFNLTSQEKSVIASITSSASSKARKSSVQTTTRGGWELDDEHASSGLIKLISFCFQKQRRR